MWIFHSAVLSPISGAKYFWNYILFYKEKMCVLFMKFVVVTLSQIFINFWSRCINLTSYVIFVFSDNFSENDNVSTNILFLGVMSYISILYSFQKYRRLKKHAINISALSWFIKMYQRSERLGAKVNSRIKFFFANSEPLYSVQIKYITKVNLKRYDILLI